jgi:hypothetical protein
MALMQSFLILLVVDGEEDHNHKNVKQEFNM